MQKYCYHCDEFFDKNKHAKEHQHPEPRFGIFKQLFLDSGMSYQEWIKTTRAGQNWAMRKIQWQEKKQTP